MKQSVYFPNNEEGNKLWISATVSCRGRLESSGNDGGVQVNCDHSSMDSIIHPDYAFCLIFFLADMTVRISVKNKLLLLHFYIQLFITIIWHLQSRAFVLSLQFNLDKSHQFEWFSRTKPFVNKNTTTLSCSFKFDQKSLKYDVTLVLTKLNYAGSPQKEKMCLLLLGSDMEGGVEWKLEQRIQLDSLLTWLFLHPRSSVSIMN